jgi:hypothetical protein
MPHEENNKLTVIEKEESKEVVPIMDRLLNAVANNGMSIDMLERFMDLAERQEKREAERAFHKAFAAFKANPPKIIKDKLVSFDTKASGRTKYKHATIGNIVAALISGMSEHGLSHRWSTTQDGANITVTCHITHELGHCEKTSLSAGADQSGGKNPIQAICSTVTYLERYTIQAATGIAVLEEDDDGRGAENVGNPVKKHTAKRDDQPANRKNIDSWKNWVDAFAKSNATLDVFTEQWDKFAAPAMEKMSEEHKKELMIAKKEMVKYLTEKETKK